MARTDMNITTDKIMEVIATLAKVDERTETILKRMEKYEDHFQGQINDVKDRVDQFESSIVGRVEKLESDKKRLLGAVAAISLIITVGWAIGGDYVKQSLFTTTAVAQTVEK